MLAFIACFPVLVASGGPEVHLVAKVPDGCQAVEGSLRFSRDGLKCVYTATKGTKVHPVIGSTLLGEYDVVSYPSIDPSGAHSAFRVLERDARRKVSLYSIVYDGKVLATEDWIGPVALDPAKGAPAYWIAHGRVQNSSGHPEPGAGSLIWGKYKSAKWQFVEDKSPPQFSSDGKLLVTTAARGNGDWNVLTVDDKHKEEKQGTGSIFEAAPGPGGHEVAYTSAYLGTDPHWMDRPQHYSVSTMPLDGLVRDSVGERLGEKYSAAGSPIYSADGKHIAFKVLRSARMGVAVDLQADAACEYSFVDELEPKPDGSEVAFVAGNDCTLDAKNGMEVLRGVEATGGKWFVVHGKVGLGEYQRAHSPRWSPDHKTLAYAAKIEGKWYAFAGAKKSDACDDIASVVWSDDGRSVWYGCLQGAELWWRKLDAG